MRNAETVPQTGGRPDDGEFTGNMKNVGTPSQTGGQGDGGFRVL